MTTVTTTLRPKAPLPTGEAPQRIDAGNLARRSATRLAGHLGGEAAEKRIPGDAQGFDPIKGGRDDHTRGPDAAGATKAGGPSSGAAEECTDPRFLWIHRQDAMSTEREQELDAQIREKLADDPEALAEYERLLESELFQQDDVSLGSPICGPGQNGEARIAILEQVLNYPEAEAISSLNRLGGRDWYRGMDFDDQQRSAKLIGVNESSTTPDGNSVRENSIEYLLTNDNVVLEWRDNAGAYGSANSNADPRVLMLNADMVDAGPGPVDLGDDDEKHVTLNTLAHEVNHLIGGDQVEESYDYFMDEYRAWFVGYSAEHGHPPTRQEAFDRASQLITGLYESITNAYENHPAEQARIVQFMAELAGMDDPGSATKEQIDAIMEVTEDLNGGDLPATLPVVTPDDDHNDLSNAG